ncbi:4'-phosphopantetheinyl transferase superfamily protein [Spirosoma luteolum]
MSAPVCIITCQTLPVVDWQPAGEPIQAGPAVWRLAVPATDELLAEAQELFTAGERDRADRFRQAADRRRFLLGRLLARSLAGAYTGQPAATVELVTGPQGKPDLNPALGWHLNLSHAGNWVVLALDRQPLGVDVEWCRPDLPLDLMVSSSLQPTEQAVVARSSDPTGQFYTYWTRKEAFVKATGQGLPDTFHEISVLDGVNLAPAALLTLGQNWLVRSFTVEPGYPAALATSTDTTTPAFLTISPTDLMHSVSRAMP